MPRAAPWLVGLFALLLAACSPYPDAAELHSLAVSGTALLEQTASEQDITAEHWPAPIAAFHPKRVHADNTGLYIAVASVFATETGYFIPRSSTFTATSGTDPSYTPLGQGVYRYEIKG